MKWIYILCSIMVVGFFSSCYDENTLAPTEDGEGMLRYEFPQGTNSWDRDIEEIAEEFNVYLIYKGFKQADFNRAWTGASGTEFFGKDLTDEQAEFSTNFLKNHVFAYLNKKILPRVLPMYYYMAYDYHNMWIMDLGFMVMEFKVAQKNVFDGLDFWGICLFYGDPCPTTGETIDTPVTKEDFYYRRGQVLLHILDRAFEKGNIEVPAGFEEGFDYKTEVTYQYGYEDDENYYLRRGFPGTLQTFSSFDPVRYISNMNNSLNFKEYIHLGMYYTREAMEVALPQSKYPLIWEKRNFVVNYMKTKYDIDLEAIAEGPEIE